MPNVLTLTGDFTYADDYAASRPDNAQASGVGGVAQPRWDTALKLMEPLFSRFPTIHVAGNHEMEPGAGCFISGNGNYWYPAVPTAQNAWTTITWPTTDFSVMNPCFQVTRAPARPEAGPPCVTRLLLPPARSQSYNNRWPHPFTTTWGDLSGPSHYYGVSYGPIHVVSLNNYVPFGAGTPQVRRPRRSAAAAAPDPGPH